MDYENYKKKYECLLKKVRKLHDENWDGCKACLEEFFPELAEQNDDEEKDENELII